MPKTRPSMDGPALATMGARHYNPADLHRCRYCQHPSVFPVHPTCGPEAAKLRTASSKAMVKRELHRG